MLLTEIKATLRLPLGDTTHDSELLSAADAATDQVERDSDRVIITQQFELSADRFPRSTQPIRLGQKPIQSIDSITYTDEDGGTQTLDPGVYALDIGKRWVYLNHEQVWPAVLVRQQSVKVTYTAGYGDDQSRVPDLVKRAVLLQTGFYFDDPTLISATSQTAYDRIIDRITPTTYQEDPV